ncbi:unnamed protein product [Rotaria magnacalcarata]|uniref:Uncharacterized protein n=1 Tax=Rotaria magnacalcarata TaxID=392030 RepID=A0A819RXK1_9BILA|nr:unnamed protein product [Rotaria magnacalcarata]CAF2060318.1 unnamed protein product [Rotaria magnacalcarata]CAF2100962.1 unnamed protein product [Rotaria magnacalcarata]CAF4052435.1 unnamed protein product [Rotaria magnacalcarata]CAF4081162.1 unnamed protein product [Rotaria magnacalcarata]
MTIRNDAFMQFDSGPGDHRLVIFSSLEQLKILEETEKILIDGTFKDLGLKTNYDNDLKCAYDANKIAALAYLQSGDVNQGFDDLYRSLTFILEPALDYFEDTYIERRRLNGRAAPRYPVNLWNMHQRTVNDLMRTNNQAAS